MALTTALIDRLPPTILAIHYLALSYHYYQVDDPLVPDHIYDYLCVRLAPLYAEIRDEIRTQVDLGDLQAGTCLKTYNQYPKRVMASFDFYRDAMRSGQMAQWLEEEYPPQRARARRRPTAPAAVAPTVRRRGPVATPAPAPTVRRRRNLGTT